MNKHQVLQEGRYTGILLHLSSLPGPVAKGTMGEDAVRFMRWLQGIGASVWQILPIGPTDADGSPYSLLSAFAGSPTYINHKGPWGPHDDLVRLSRSCHSLDSLVELLASSLDSPSDEKWKIAYFEFVSKNTYWIDDYTLYDVIRKETGQPWYLWPAKLKHRDAVELKRYASTRREKMTAVKLLQFLFCVQWSCLKACAEEHELKIYGDMPIFCSYDSADVWSHPEYFMLDEKGELLELTGVPPDAFSETGQLWGGPQYNWERLEKDDYAWWVKRIEVALGYYDLLRIDHFRGLESCWVVPAGSENAVNGYWRKGPGAKLFNAIDRALGPVPFIAEDLGVITPEVDELRRQLGMPGMRVLQFDFDGDPKNPHSPINHTKDSVVYTGTHDNDTLMGWWTGLSAAQKALVVQGVPRPELDMPWSVIDCALQSKGFLAIVPMQDLLGLGSEARMNTPGQAYGNWRWRFQWPDIPEGLAEKITGLIQQARR